MIKVNNKRGTSSSPARRSSKRRTPNKKTRSATLPRGSVARDVKKSPTTARSRSWLHRRPAPHHACPGRVGHRRNCSGQREVDVVVLNYTRRRALPSDTRARAGPLGPGAGADPVRREWAQGVSLTTRRFISSSGVECLIPSEIVEQRVKHPSSSSMSATRRRDGPRCRSAASRSPFA